jgi:RNA polymerase sigma-70 factor (ECF subfamily)
LTTDNFQLATDGSRFPNSAFVFESPKPGALLPPDVERLFRLYHDPLVRYLTRRLGDRDWAEEVAQETFLRALRQEGTLASERSWLFAVATNLVRDEARRDLRRRRHLELLAEAERGREEEAAATPMLTAAESLEERQERAREAAFARRAVDSLAERDRLALLMREEGLDYDEIASALGLAVASVGTTLSRARRRLAEAYEALQAERRARGGGTDRTAG